MVPFTVVAFNVDGCASILWSSLVPTVMAIKRFVHVSKSRTILRVIQRARISYATSWLDIPVWCTHLMHSFDGDMGHGVIFRLMVSLASFLHHSDMVDAF